MSPSRRLPAVVRRINTVILGCALMVALGFAIQIGRAVYHVITGAAS